MSPTLAESPSFRVAAEQARTTTEADIQKVCSEDGRVWSGNSKLEVRPAHIGDPEMGQLQNSTTLEGQQAGWTQSLEALVAGDMSLEEETATLREV
ncbi:uncharacterized protein N7503_010046 [Penicillium pulvis]|uniref:uncharacterized protein n=1 Tax=Penicillium pulvis TaxID=1562058 RepID=UPI0025470AC1|nr:uncharacterized protein N7503_010046 [Penicillium pulvis]KAJ5784834.1 hypothetical protein N7503_010046 [Penicillium pulvis]